MVRLPQPSRRGPPYPQGRKMEGLLPRSKRSLPDLADPRNIIIHKKGGLHIKQSAFFKIYALTLNIEISAHQEKSRIAEQSELRYCKTSLCLSSRNVVLSLNHFHHHFSLFTRQLIHRTDSVIRKKVIVNLRA